MITVTKKTTRTITGCWRQCPHFSTEGMERAMVCEHPYFDDKDSYAGFIISWEEDIENGFPSKCPLFESNGSRRS